MPNSDPLNPGPFPQFATAEFSVKTGGDTCKSCNQPISGRYYRINGALSCETCAEISRRQIPTDSHASFVRGILFGIGGAIIGLILYSTFGIVTGLVIGYLSLAVGYIVGKAINMGSRGSGGRRYQIAAVVLTYAAVSLSAIPIAISHARKESAPNGAAKVQNFSSLAAPSTQNPAGSAGIDSGDPATPGNSTTKPGFAAAVAELALIGLASPFLELQDPFHGLIGLVILSVGIRIAWRLTAGSSLQVLGPFEKGTPGPTSAA